MLTAESILSAQKSNIEVLFGLQSKAFEGVEKLVELNLQTAKAAMNEAADTARAALSVKAAGLLLEQLTRATPAAMRAASSRMAAEETAARSSSRSATWRSGVSSSAARPSSSTSAIAWNETILERRKCVRITDWAVENM